MGEVTLKKPAVCVSYSLSSIGKTSRKVAKHPGIEKFKGAKRPGRETSRWRTVQVANRPGSESSKVVAVRPGGELAKQRNVWLAL